MRKQHKMDTLDFIINVLLEHEKKLDSIAERLENLTRDFDYMLKKERHYLMNQYEQTRKMSKKSIQSSRR
jgi:uncharacterized ferredoxin-like protein